jgi:GDPmannose 4,6-dehydratase
VPKIAFITGITGQDGSYLSELLLEKGYNIHGLVRRSSSLNTSRIDHLLDPSNKNSERMSLHYGDLSDASSMTNIINRIKPDEVYNLGAQSHVGVSFDSPEYTSNITGLGTLRLLEAIKLLGLEKKIRFYQASTSELYGDVKEVPQTEKTPFNPQSPYAIAKLYAYWITTHYRETFGIYACNGILFNHESCRRGENFVTRKITLGLSNIAVGITNCLYLGNIDSKRDWGHAKDYVEMQWLMLQQPSPQDFVIATGKQYSIREFIKWAASALDIEIEFHGSGLQEVGRVTKIMGNKAPKIQVGQDIIKINPKYFRPAEVSSLLGDPSKAKSDLGWEPKISAKALCTEMMEHDLKLAKHRAQII